MNNSGNFTADKIDPYLHKRVVVTYKDKEKGNDAQIIRGTLDGNETGANNVSALVIRNESGDRMKIPVSDVQDLREGE